MNVSQRSVKLCALGADARSVRMRAADARSVKLCALLRCSASAAMGV